MNTHTLASPTYGTTQSLSSHKATPTNSNDNPPRASLLGIPGEIRNQIYEKVFSSPTPYRAKFRGSTNPRPLLTCHQIYQEAKFIAFTNTTFLTAEWPGKGHDEAVHCLALDPEKVKQIRILDLSRHAHCISTRKVESAAADLNSLGLQLEVIIVNIPEFVLTDGPRFFHNKLRSMVSFLAKFLVTYKPLKHMVVISDVPTWISDVESFLVKEVPKEVDDGKATINAHLLPEFRGLPAYETNNRALSLQEYNHSTQSNHPVSRSVVLEFRLSRSRPGAVAVRYQIEDVLSG